MNLQLLLILLIWIPAILVEGFTSTKKFARAEHLRYANLERSHLFTADHDRAAQQLHQLHQERILEQPKKRTNEERAAIQQRKQNEKCRSKSCTGAPSKKHVSPSVNNRHSSKDWLYNLRSLPRSSVLQEIKNPVLTLAGWATIISVVQWIMSISSNPTLRSIATNMCVSHSAHSFLVSSLGLLLVFRTNSAYQRFQVRCT